MFKMYTSLTQIRNPNKISIISIIIFRGGSQRNRHLELMFTGTFLVKYEGLTCRSGFDMTDEGNEFAANAGFLLFMKFEGQCV
jgi:hypothetical protein